MISYINCHNFTLFLSIFYYIVSLLLNITYSWAEVWWCVGGGPPSYLPPLLVLVR